MQIYSKFSLDPVFVVDSKWITHNTKWEKAEKEKKKNISIEWIHPVSKYYVESALPSSGAASVNKTAITLN